MERWSCSADHHGCRADGHCCCFTVLLLLLTMTQNLGALSNTTLLSYRPAVWKSKKSFTGLKASVGRVGFPLGGFKRECVSWFFPDFKCWWPVSSIFKASYSRQKAFFHPITLAFLLYSHLLPALLFCLPLWLLRTHFITLGPPR